MINGMNEAHHSLNDNVEVACIAIGLSRLGSAQRIAKVERQEVDEGASIGVETLSHQHLFNCGVDHQVRFQI